MWTKKNLTSKKEVGILGVSTAWSLDFWKRSFLFILSFKLCTQSNIYMYMYVGIYSIGTSPGIPFLS